MRELKCSSLPALEACASFVSDGKSSPPADLGTLVHHALAERLRGNEPPDLDDEAEMLMERGIRAWNEVKDSFPHGRIEESFVYVDEDNKWVLRGHPDVAESCEAVLDWKSGWKQNDYSLQLNGYALIAGASKAVVVWLRDTRTPFEVLPVDHKETIRRIDSIVARAGSREPCDFCAWCYHFPACPARATADTYAVAVFEQAAGEILSGRDLARLQPMAAQVKRALKQYNEALRRHVEHEGSLDLGDGYELRITEVPHSTIEPGAAWEPMFRDLGKEGMSSCIKVAKGPLAKAIRAKAKRGKKQEAVSDFYSELRGLGALVDSKPTKMLVRTKKIADSSCVPPPEGA